MKFLVTGADGFIGSHLCEKLLDKGYDTRACVYYNSWDNNGWLDDVSPSTRSELDIRAGDIRDPRFVRECVLGVDRIIHLASLIAIPYSYAAPQSYVDTNINGTLNILEACRDSNPEASILQMSTSEIYGSAQFVPMTEDHPKNPQSPYAASKVGADALALSYHASFDLRVTVARPFNTYGPRQTPRAVIPSIIRQALFGSGDIFLGNTGTTRDFTYVTDTCEALIALAMCDAAVGKEINIGNSTEIAISDVVSAVEKITSKRLNVILDEQRLRPANSEVDRLYACTQLLEHLTLWSPAVDFVQGLIKTIDWTEYRGINSKDYGSYRL